MRYEQFIGQAFMVEPSAALTCQRLCGLTKEQAAGCIGPRILTEVTGTLYTPGNSTPALLVAPVSALCMKEYVEGEKPPTMKPLPEDPPAAAQ